MEFLDNRTGKTPIYKTEFDIRIDDKFLICHYKSYHSSFYSYSNIFNDDIPFRVEEIEPNTKISF